VVYTARKEYLIRPIFKAYTRQTGVKIKYITGKAPVLLQRLKAEGRNTPADMLITVDDGTERIILTGWHRWAIAGIPHCCASFLFEKKIENIRQANSPQTGQYDCRFNIPCRIVRFPLFIPSIFPDP